MENKNKTGIEAQSKTCSRKTVNGLLLKTYMVNDRDIRLKGAVTEVVFEKGTLLFQHMFVVADGKKQNVLQRLFNKKPIRYLVTAKFIYKADGWDSHIWADGKTSTIKIYEDCDVEKTVLNVEGVLSTINWENFAL